MWRRAVVHHPPTACATYRNSYPPGAAQPLHTTEFLVARRPKRRRENARLSWRSIEIRSSVLRSPRLRQHEAETGERVALSWIPDWSWGLPLLVLTDVAHVSAIVWTAKMLGLMEGLHSRKASRFVIFVAVAALACAVYLALETAIW